MASLTKYGFVIDGKNIEVPMAMAMTMLHVKGKLLFLYAYSIYRTEADLQWVRAASSAWAGALSMAN